MTPAGLPSWPAAPVAYGPVVLRQFSDRDVPMAQELATDPYVPLGGSLPANASREQARDWVDRQRGRHRRTGRVRAGRPAAQPPGDRRAPPRTEHVRSRSRKLFADSRRVMCSACPANLLEVTRNDDAVIGVFYVIRIGGVAIALIAIGLLARRWLRASPPQRDAVMPVAVAGVVAFAAVIAAYAARVAGAPGGVAGVAGPPGRGD